MSCALQQRQDRPGHAFHASTSAANDSAAGPRRAALVSDHPRTGLRTVSTVIQCCPAPGSGASLLATGNVKMLIIDEIHHVRVPVRRYASAPSSTSSSSWQRVANSDRRPPGRMMRSHAIQTDPQLANRFEPAPLPRWTMNEDYLRLFASFEVGLELEQASHFHRAGVSDENFGALGRHDREDFGVAQPGGDGGDRARSRTHHKRRA